MRTNIRVAGIMFKNNKLVTSKMRKKDKSYYVLPGGGVEDHETIYEAISREIMEELNVKITKLKLVYIKELKIKDKGRGIEFYFYIEEYSGELKKGFDPEIKETIFEDIAFLNLNELTNIAFYPIQLIDLLEKDKKTNFNELIYLST